MTRGVGREKAKTPAGGKRELLTSGMGEVHEKETGGTTPPHHPRGGNEVCDPPGSGRGPPKGTRVRVKAQRKARQTRAAKG